MNYALALKGNAGTVHDDVRRYLDDAEAETITAAPVVDGDHGRIETRAGGDLPYLFTGLARRIAGPTWCTCLPRCRRTGENSHHG